MSNESTGHVHGVKQRLQDSLRALDQDSGVMEAVSAFWCCGVSKQAGREFKD